MRAVVLLLVITAIQACATKGYEAVRFGASLKQEKLAKVDFPFSRVKSGLNCDLPRLQQSLLVWSETLRLHKSTYHTSPYRSAGRMLLTFEKGQQFVFEIYRSGLNSDDLLFLIGTDGVVGIEGGGKGEVFIGDPIRFDEICVRPQLM